MAVDAFTNVMRAVSFGLSVGFVLLVAECIRYARLQRCRRPYDWARDGECDNHSKVRIISE